MPVATNPRQRWIELHQTRKGGPVLFKKPGGVWQELPLAVPPRTFMWDTMSEWGPQLFGTEDTYRATCAAAASAAASR